MAEFQSLLDATMSLSKSVSDFPIGAVSMDDFRPIEENIRNMRKTLKHLDARLLILKAQNELQTTSEEPEDTEINTLRMLHEATANSLINDKAIKLCLHSNTIQAILSGEEGDQEMQTKIYSCMCKLFALNDNIMSVQQAIEEALQQQLDLKIACQNALFEYKSFLKEQEQLCSKRLQETNPEIARNKEKTNKTLEKINIMKRLITNLIAASGRMLMEEPMLVKLLEDHRELINVETIFKKSQGTESDGLAK